MGTRLEQAMRPCDNRDLCLKCHKPGNTWDHPKMKEVRNGSSERLWRECGLADTLISDLWSPEL